MDEYKPLAVGYCVNRPTTVGDLLHTDTLHRVGRPSLVYRGVRILSPAEAVGLKRAQIVSAAEASNSLEPRNAERGGGDASSGGSGGSGASGGGGGGGGGGGSGGVEAGTTQSRHLAGQTGEAAAGGGGQGENAAPRRRGPAKKAKAGGSVRTSIRPTLNRRTVSAR